MCLTHVWLLARGWRAGDGFRNGTMFYLLAPGSLWATVTLPPPPTSNGCSNTRGQATPEWNRSFSSILSGPVQFYLHKLYTPSGREAWAQGQVHLLPSFSLYSNELQAGRQGFDSWKGQEIFLYSTASRPSPGSTQPLIKWVQRALSPGVKRPGS
jgi:hypothetical protein